MPSWFSQCSFTHHQKLDQPFNPFCSLDIGPVAWQTYVDDLGISWDELNITFASNCAGLAVGCIIFIPFALKYGRRSVYIISTAITFAMAIWQAKLNTFWEMVVTSVISGFSGAVSETLVQITVSKSALGFWKHCKLTQSRLRVCILFTREAR